MISFFVTIAIVLCAAFLARHGILNLVEGGVVSKNIIPNILDYTYVRNEGAAFGMLYGKKTLLIIVTSVIIIAILIYVIKTRKTIGKCEKFSLALIVAGGFSNMFERVIDSSVVDYIDTHLLPVFNVADIAVTCGCILLIISIFFLSPKENINDERKQI